MAWIPNIAAYDYLKAIGSTKQRDLKRIKNAVNIGYQRFIARSLFKSDGSFAVWADDGESNIWVTAYMAKLLSRAKRVIELDDKYIKSSLDFLKNHQKSDGRFECYSHISHYSSDNAGDSIPLTSFVISSFMENIYYVKNTPKYKNVIEKGVDFILQGSSNISDNFESSITAFTMASYNIYYTTNETDKLLYGMLDDLLSNAQETKTEIFWFNKRRLKGTEEISSIHIEIASYALMALRRTDQKSKPKYFQAAFKVMTWLMSQRNENGGFESSYDTGEILFPYFSLFFSNIRIIQQNSSCRKCVSRDVIRLL